MALDYPTATTLEIVAALRVRDVSAVELAQAAIARIKALDGALNAVVVRDFDNAIAAARAADEQLAGGVTGPLLGVPMTVKESWDLTGYPTTWGDERHRQHRATSDATIVQRLKGAGAVILGKTNVPVWCADWQSENPIYGRTNNPHALTHSPGGSSGGGAAALAAGFVPLEMGSDIGGSIRIPATFCGVFGHKTTHNIVPFTGHAMGGFRGQSPELSVGGPMARSAADLKLALSVVAGPDGEAAKGYRLTLPAPRHTKLADYRLLVLDEHPRAKTSTDVRAAIARLAGDLERAGAKVARQSDLLPDLGHLHGVYLKMMLSIVTRRDPNARQPISVHEWFDLQDQQVRNRREWAALFSQFDAVIAPAFGTSTFPHALEKEWKDRTIVIDGQPTPYGDQLAWQGPAIFANLPSTAVPLGKNAEGLPIGAQIIGPYLEDRTTIALAGLIHPENAPIAEFPAHMPEMA